MIYQENDKRTTTTIATSSSSTRARAYAREATLAEKTMAQMSAESIRALYYDVLGRPMPRATERQLLQALEMGTPAQYFTYALEEAANAPMPSWRYALAIVARLKAQQVPPEDLLWWC